MSVSANVIFSACKNSCNSLDSISASWYCFRRIFCCAIPFSASTVSLAMTSLAASRSACSRTATSPDSSSLLSRLAMLLSLDSNCCSTQSIDCAISRTFSLCLYRGIRH